MSKQCQLCDQRKAKRYCPAKLELICTICCGSKREVEIDCPSGCVYLQAGREHEKERNSSSDHLQLKDPRFSDRKFVESLSPAITVIDRTILEVRDHFPEMTDADLREALESLIKTYETQMKGIYYDFNPSGPISREIFLAIKQLVDAPLENSGASGRKLRTDVVLDSLKFNSEILEATILPRPKSRAFLDDLQKFFVESPVQKDESRIILP
jgi:hypothetical protein